MQDESAEGTEFFKCDFCRQGWSEDRPMVEGHRGSLICANCLTIAYAELVTHKSGVERQEGQTCRLCLEEREETHWAGPVDEDALACRRCVKQSAGVLHKDRDTEWSKPREE